MSRIKTSRSDEYLEMKESAREMNETNDCSVRAIAVVCDLEYKEAVALCEKHGRKARRGMLDYQIFNALKEVGKTYKRIPSEHFIGQYPGAHVNLSNVTTHHPERFPKVWKDGKKYLLLTRGHILAVVDGVNHDWTKGKAVRVTSIYEIN